MSIFSLRFRAERVGFVGFAGFADVWLSPGDSTAELGCVPSAEGSSIDEALLSLRFGFAALAAGCDSSFLLFEARRRAREGFGGRLIAGTEFQSSSSENKSDCLDAD